jgi:hypothetical protein
VSERSLSLPRPFDAGDRTGDNSIAGSDAVLADRRAATAGVRIDRMLTQDGCRRRVAGELGVPRT